MSLYTQASRALCPRRILSAVLLAGLFWAGTGGAIAAQTRPLDPPELVAREADLAQQLRCVVCQNQTVAESRAPLAQDMRQVIREQLAQGRSDAEVVAFFEQRYGAFVRYQPPWRPSTWLLWCGPFVMALAGLALWRRSLRRREPSPPLGEADRRRAQAWLEEGGRPDQSEESA